MTVPQVALILWTTIRDINCYFGSWKRVSYYLLACPSLSKRQRAFFPLSLLAMCLLGYHAELSWFVKTSHKLYFYSDAKWISKTNIWILWLSLGKWYFQWDFQWKHWKIANISCLSKYFSEHMSYVSLVYTKDTDSFLDRTFTEGLVVS